MPEPVRASVAPPAKVESDARVVPDAKVAPDAKAAPEAKKDAGGPTPAVRLRKFIDLVIEDKLSFALFRAVAVDFSSTGMRIITDQYLAKNTKYTFTMKQQPALTLRGDVRWVRPSERDTFQCGVLFVDVNAQDRERLERFIDFERQRSAIPS